MTVSTEQLIGGRAGELHPLVPGTELVSEVVVLLREARHGHVHIVAARGGTAIHAEGSLRERVHAAVGNGSVIRRTVSVVIDGALVDGGALAAEGEHSLDVIATERLADLHRERLTSGNVHIVTLAAGVAR